MRLSITHTKNNTYFYMIKSFRKNGKNTSKIIECLGNLDEVVKRLMEKILLFGQKNILSKRLKKKMKIR